MRGSSDGARLQIEGRECWVAAVVTISLPTGDLVFDGELLAVTTLRVDFSNTSSAPAQVRASVGTPSATASFTLAGRIDPADASKTASWLFARWNQDSPLWRKDAQQCPVTIDVGVYPDGCHGVPELIRQFTGYVDSYSRGSDGSVSFQCIDEWTRLRALPEAPPAVAGVDMTTEFAHDFMMRRASATTISSWPTQRTNCVFAVGLRGSVLPDVGVLTSVSTRLGIFFADGKFGRGLQAVNLDGPVNYLTTADIGNDFFIEQWCRPRGPRIDIYGWNTGRTSNDIFRVFLVGPGDPDGKPEGAYADFIDSVGTLNEHYWNTPISDVPHYFSVKYHSPIGSASWSVVMELDGVTHSSGTLTAAHARSYALNEPHLDFEHIAAGGTTEAVQVTTETSPPSNNGFVPRASYDPSLNVMQVFPGFAANAAAQDLSGQMCEAELAEAGFDEEGDFFFYNRNTLRTVVEAREVTSENSLNDLGEESPSAAVINRARLGYTTWTEGDQVTFYSPAAPLHIPKNTTGANAVVRYVDTDTLYMDVSHESAQILPNGIDPLSAPSANWYRASLDRAGTNPHPGIDIRTVMVASNRLKITYQNATNRDAWLSSPFNYTDLVVGTPSLWINGIPVTPNAESTADYQYPRVSAIGTNGLAGAAGTRWGEVPWSSTGNQFRQDEDSTNGLAKFAVQRSHASRPNVTGLKLRFDPRVQLNDWLHVKDPDVSYVDDYIQVTAKTLELDDGDWSLTCDGRTAAPPGGWLLGITGRSEIAADPDDSTAYLYAE